MKFNEYFPNIHINSTTEYSSRTRIHCVFMRTMVLDDASKLRNVRRVFEESNGSTDIVSTLGKVVNM